jgi:protein SCO1
LQRRQFRSRGARDDARQADPAVDRRSADLRRLSKILLACAFAGGIATAAGGWYAYAEREPTPRSAAELMDVLMWNREPVGGPFALIDHNGRLRTDSDFRGRLMLVYFGFPFCSDVCPIDLQSIADAFDKLGPAAEAVQPLFITVDPE